MCRLGWLGGSGGVGWGRFFCYNNFCCKCWIFTWIISIHRFFTWERMALFFWGVSLVNLFYFLGGWILGMVGGCFYPGINRI